MCDEIELNDESFDKVLSDYEVMLERACLDKYIFNPEMQRRFYENASEDKKELDITSSYAGTKNVCKSEYVSCMEDFFDINRSDMEAEFNKRMLAHVSQDKLDKYYNILANIWIKGAGLRDTSPEIASLDMSIYEFFKEHIENPRNIVRKKIKLQVVPLFNSNEIKQFLLINKELIELYFEQFASYCLSNGLELSASDTWLHRGCYLSKPYQEGVDYIEKRFLTSYTTSITIMELFSQIVPSKTSALLSGKLYDLYDRVFAFFAFIPGMPSNQQEVILIPAARKTEAVLMHSTDTLLDYELKVK